MTQALTTTRSNWMQPNTFEEADRLAKYLAKYGTNALPKAYQNDPGAIVIAIGIGEGYGMSPIQSLQKLHVIHGKVSMEATEMRARAMAHEDCEFFRVTDVTSTSATVELARKSWPSGVIEAVIVNIEDAKRAKWGMRGGSWDSSSSWVKTPDDMLVARATSKAARRYFPELFSGVYETSEIRDIVEVEATVIPEEEKQEVSVGKLEVSDVKPVSSEEVPSEPVSLGDALSAGLVDVPREKTDDAAEPAPTPLIINPALRELEEELESLPTTVALRNRLTELLPSADWASVKPHRLIPEALRHFSEGEPVEEQKDQPSQGPEESQSSGEAPSSGQPVDNQPSPAPEEDTPPPDSGDPGPEEPDVVSKTVDSIELRDLLLGYVDASTSSQDLERVQKDLKTSRDGLIHNHLLAVQDALKRKWKAVTP